MAREQKINAAPGQHRICILAFTVSLLLFSPADGAYSAGDLPLTGPRIRTEGETFDFGLVPQQAFVTHTYWLKNPGTETTTIQRLTPNCGCTLAPLTDSVIASGDSVPVEITFGSRGMIGLVEKHVRILSNASGRVPALTFRATVVTDSSTAPPLRIAPWVVRVDPTTQPARGDWSVPVILKNDGKTTIEVRAIDFPPRDFSLSETQVSLKPGEAHPITITLPPLPEGSLGRSVTFESSDPPGVRLTVPILRRGK
jgi:hypothetical protein